VSIFFRPMRIAVYSHSFPPSIDGVCRRFSSLVYELLHSQHELLIFTLEEDLSGLDLFGLPHPRHVTLQSSFPATYPMKRIASPSLTNISRIVSALRAFRPDVIHITVDAVTLLFAAVALALDIPIAGSIHTDVDKILRSLNKAEWVVRTGWLLEAADSMFLDTCATTSQSYREELQRRGCRVDHVVLTSVDTTVFHPGCVTPEERQAIRSRLTFGHPDGFLLLYVGRLSLEKGIELLLDALMLPEMDNVYLAIIGDGPTAADLASFHGEGHRVFCQPGFLPHRELAKLYAACDIHVSASVFETLGNTVLEAYASGTPVVVPYAQGFKDTVDHGTDGFLFEAGSRESFVNSVNALRGNPGLMTRMGDAARIRIEGQRTAAAVALDYVAWYKRTVQRHAERVAATAQWVILVVLVWPFLLAFMITLRLYDQAVYLHQQAMGVIDALADELPAPDKPAQAL